MLNSTLTTDPILGTSQFKCNIKIYVHKLYKSEKKEKPWTSDTTGQVETDPNPNEAFSVSIKWIYDLHHVKAL